MKNEGIVVQKKDKPFLEADGGGSRLNLVAFKNGDLTAASYKSGSYYNGLYRLERDKGVHSGNGGHGGSFWKLFYKNKCQGTYDKEGNRLRK